MRPLLHFVIKARVESRAGASIYDGVYRVIDQRANMTVRAGKLSHGFPTPLGALVAAYRLGRQEAMLLAESLAVNDRRRQ